MISPRRSKRLHACTLLWACTLSGVTMAQPPGGSSQSLAASIGNATGALPPHSTFIPPQPNACSSRYDQFYGSEPGVYAFWGLCERTPNAALYDYAGINDLVRGHGAWGHGEISAALPGPVPDQEPAAEVENASTFVEAQDLPLNSHAGTLAAWLRTDLQGSTPVTAVFLGAVQGKSLISLSTFSKGTSVCISGVFVDAAGTRSAVTDDCSTAARRWQRVVLKWSDTNLWLFVDGIQKAVTQRAGALDDKLFYYRLFPGHGDANKPMALAKVVVANQDWTIRQIAFDYSPNLPIVPAGGLLVTEERLGTIHADVLGYQDNNANILNPNVVSAMLKGLGAAGVRSVRYSSGAMGIGADTVDWRGGQSCTGLLQHAEAPHQRTGNDLETYFERIVKPLSLHAGYVVNYGSNPPDCTAGGSPAVNGADLVDYANNKSHLGIRYWEIGNEQYNGGKSELDLHQNPSDGTSYAQQESLFFKAMKARDPSIQIGIPLGTGVFSWETDWSYPVLRSALYDAVIVHSYPMRDPISDGSTLYPDRVASNMQRTHGWFLHVETMLLNAGKSPSGIWVTEWDGDVSGNRWSRQSLGAVMPIFATMQLAEYMTAGVPYATWLEQGSSDGCYFYNFDDSAPGSYSWPGCGGSWVTYTGPVKGELPVGLKPGDLSPAAHAFQLLSVSGFVTEGEKMLRVFPDSRNAPWLAAYAATHGQAYSVILINRDRDASHTVPVRFEHMQAGTGVEQWTYGRTQYDGTRTGDWGIPPVHLKHGAWSKTYMATLPPWSVNILVFQ
jgi:hypothetical protein